MNFGIGAFGVSRHDGVCSPVYVVLEPSNQKSLGFLRWYFENKAFQKAAQSFGNGILAHRSAIGWDVLKSMQINIPSIEEQVGIAAFLNRECGKINALIEEQERLIGFLDEKRQTVISRAVTKGVNPDAPVKDSGISWLGDIPDHWTVSRLKHAGRTRGGAGFPLEFQGVQGEELPFYKVANLGMSEDGKIIGKSDHSISRENASELGAKIIPKHAVVYAKIGAALLLNKRRMTDVECCIDNNMTAFIANEKISSEWAYWWLSILDFGRLANPGAVPSFSEGDQKELPIFIPPRPEQDDITAFISSELMRTDTLKQECIRMMDLLKERRAALISAAVTGKIDVRGLASEDEIARVEQEAA
jgi:type I restriction enzyme S subunit